MCGAGCGCALWVPRHAGCVHVCMCVCVTHTCCVCLCVVYTCIMWVHTVRMLRVLCGGHVNVLRVYVCLHVCVQCAK